MDIHPVGWIPVWISTCSHHRWLKLPGVNHFDSCPWINLFWTELNCPAEEDLEGFWAESRIFDANLFSGNPTASGGAQGPLISVQWLWLDSFNYGGPLLCFIPILLLASRSRGCVELTSALQADCPLAPCSASLRDSLRSHIEGSFSLFPIRLYSIYSIFK